MSALSEARSGLTFDVVTSNFDDFDNNKLLLADETEFHNAAMMMKFSCQKILKGIAEYEAAYQQERK